MKKLQEARDLYSFNKMQNNDGNAMFKEYDSRLNKQIVYWPNTVDLRAWDFDRLERKGKNDRPLVGFAVANVHGESHNTTSNLRP